MQDASDTCCLIGLPLEEDDLHKVQSSTLSPAMLKSPRTLLSPVHGLSWLREGHMEPDLSFKVTSNITLDFF